MAAATPHILLLGGHGKISLLLTRKIIARSWNLTSVIRNPSQKDAILAAADVGDGKGKGKIEVLVESLDDVKSVDDAKRVLVAAGKGRGVGEVGWVVWCAGAGGKGGVDRTYAIDRDAASYFIKAATTTPSIKKFLLVSALASRSLPAPWWSSTDISTYKSSLATGLPDYYKAKIVSDETLAVLGEARREKDGEFGWICLRPGLLAGGEEGQETGKVRMGKIGVKGSVQRGDVAEVAVQLLEKPNAKGWFDLLGANEEDAGKSVEEEIERVLSEGIDSFEGESLEEMKKRVL